MDLDALFQAHRDFFDFGYLRKTVTSMADASDDELVEMLLRADNANPPAPNCIFDVHHYNLMRTRLGQGDPLNPIVHYLTQNAVNGISVNALFDEGYYRHHSKVDDASSIGAIIHALKNMQDGPRRFSPFVDIDFICARTGRMNDSDLLSDLFTGALQPNQPHPLVDVGYIDRQSVTRIENLQDAIRHYWNSGEDLSTHPLFDVAYYKSQFPAQAGIVRSVYHYLISPDPVSPHALFEPAYYRDQVLDELGRAPTRLLEHFVSMGQALGLSPSPFFDTAFYRSQTNEGDNALQHYLSVGHLSYAPHAMIDVAQARLFAQSIKRSSKSTAQLLAENTQSVPMSVTPEFDPIYYRKTLENAGHDHHQLRRRYFREGYPQGERPNGLLSLPYIETQCRRFGINGTTCLASYFEQRWHRRRRIMLALASMQDTAENRSWYELCKSQLDNPNIEFIVVSVESGPMSEAFFKVAHVWHLSEQPMATIEKKALRNSVENLARILASNPVELAFVDCSKGLALLQAFARLGVPQISFGDAGLSQLSADEVDLLSRSSDQIMCRSPQLRASLEKNLTRGMTHIADGSNTHVAAHRITDSQRRRARQSLGLSEDDILILSSGGPEIEHGADLFGALAAQCFEDAEFGPNVSFCWHGPGRFFGNRPKFYARHFAETVQNDNQFRMIADQDFTTVLRAADIYVKLGRDRCNDDDMLQAVGAGLPVVVMRGSPEVAALAEAEAVLVVDAFDLTGMRLILRDLAADPQERKAFGDRARAAFQADFDLAAFVSRMNNAIRRCVPDLALSKPADTPTGQLLLVLPDESLFESFDTIAEKRSTLGSTPVLWLSHQQIDTCTCPAELRNIVTRSACSEIAVVFTADKLDRQEIGRFSESYWLTLGKASELSALFLKGLEFDEIYTCRPTQIDEMRNLNPRIAETMTHLDWSAS